MLDNIRFVSFFIFKNFFKKTIVKKGQTCYNLFKVKKGQKDKTKIYSINPFSLLSV